MTKYKNYKKFDIIHIHWLSEGFISIKNLSKIKKPVVWTMRDMWAFTSGSHYTMDFNKFEKSYLSKLIKFYKKKHYNLNFKFVAPSNWLLNKAKNSLILNKFNIDKINNNIDINDFKFIGKDKAKKKLKIKSNKKIILYGAQNPQSNRKGWKLFLQTMKKLDKKIFSTYFWKFLVSQ